MSAGGERTEDATPRRRAASLARGVSARSALAESALAITAAAAPAYVFAHRLAGWPYEFHAIVDAAVTIAHGARTDQVLWLARETLLGDGLWSAALVAWMAALVASSLGALACGSLRFAPAAIAVTFARFGQRAGIARIASEENVVQTAGPGIAMAAVAVVSTPVLVGASLELAKGLDLYAQAGVAAQHSVALWSHAAGTIGIASAVDIAIQRRRHAQRLKMTPRELRDERAQTEGRPEAKQRRRAAGARQARNVRIAAIRRATAIVTNPQHLAIALRYAPPEIDVPVVVARGADLLAPVVRAAARAFGVPVVESPELARELYETVDIDEAIPEECYAAVAAVFTWIIRTRGALRRGDEDDS